MRTATLAARMRKNRSRPNTGKVKRAAVNPRSIPTAIAQVAIASTTTMVATTGSIRKTEAR